MTLTGNSSEDIPLDILRHIDRLGDEYEAALRSTSNPQFDKYIDRIEPTYKARLTRELIAIAAEHLEKQGCLLIAELLAAANPQYKELIAEELASPVDDAATAVFQPSEPRRRVSSRRRRTSRGLHIRCPHCSNNVELIGDAKLDSVSCGSCGSNFSLIDSSKETKMATVLQRIDRFELVSRLGIGGFGTVWKARDTELDRAVAVKIPRYGDLSREEIEQFFREARSAAQLRHPNIVPVHEVGREGDTVFIVSDLIRGVSLADMLTGARPSANETASLCKTVAEALDHAHRKGVVHRDLKPSNLMIDDDGVPYLMDFGLAKRDADEVTMTIDGQIIGTPAYMSPEQAGGQSQWADRRTDIYSLGVMLFEMLTGELPFRGNAQMQVHQRLRDDAPNVRSLNRLLPLDIATICAKCLEREPGSRYQTARDVADELQRFLDRVPIKARRVSLPQQWMRWAIRKPIPATLAALVTLLAIVGPSVALLIYQQKTALAASNSENQNLIIQLERDKDQANSLLTKTQRELSVLAGQVSPSDLWSRDAAFPPKKQMLASLLAARSGQLVASVAGESARDAAMRWLTLSIIYEQSERKVEAVKTLQQAVAALELLRSSEPRSVPIAHATADAYERLANLAGTDELASAKAWQEKATGIHRQIAEVQSDNPLVNALRLDAELKSMATTNLAKAGPQLQDLKTLHETLGQQWPVSLDDIYVLACRLAGQPPLLNEAVMREGD